MCSGGFEGVSRDQYLNCCQSVIFKLAELASADRKVLVKAGAGFGGGFAGIGKTCGALTGGIILIGLLNDTIALENVGAFMVMLEATAAEVAVAVTKKLRIPTVGIEAGVGCDGQCMVSRDVLGIYGRPVGSMRRSLLTSTT
jgi:C_GCAxxG_C_C family probable redox protein